MATDSRARISTHYRLILVAVLLVAAILRLYGLNNLSPPGLEHDEVAHWLINLDIISGNLAPYFTDAYGHEAGFHYVQVVFMTLLGDNAFALRLPSAFAGLLLIAVTFALSRRMFGVKTALLSASLLAVLFWPVFYSRLALRAVALPLMAGLAAYFWWKAWNIRSLEPGKSSGFASLDSINASSHTWFIVAGLFAGLTFYTYMASRVIPIFFILYLIYLALIHRPTLKTHGRGVLLFILTYLVVVAPLAIYLLSHPGAESRIGEVDAPLIALAGGVLRPVLENSLKVIAMFGFQGDPLWRQNVADLPVFDPFIALFFYIGLAISLWRWREPRHLFIVLWLFTATIPSIVTIDAPSNIRIINALPVVTIFPVIGLEVIHFFQSLSTVSVKLSPETGRKIIFLLIASLFLFNGARTAQAIFRIWPNEEEVQFVWQVALTDAAAYLDDSTDNGPVAVGGWTPETMDPPTMELNLRREDLSLRYFDPSEALIIPAREDDTGQQYVSRIVHPTALPLHSSLARLLANWSTQTNSANSFTLYEIDQAVSIRPGYPAEVTFGNELTLLGIDLEETPPGTNDEVVNAPINLLTYWRVDEAPAGARRIFLHHVDDQENIVEQDDRLGAPASHWTRGDIIIQRLTLSELAGNSDFELRLGVYNPVTGRRLLTDEGSEFEVLGKLNFDP